jgi:hypothetical protein
MKLRRQKRKPEQALDALASVTKIWSEWQLGKKASKGIAKAKELRPPGKLKRILSLKWVKVGGAVAVAGGTAAAVGKKLKGDDPASYSGPAPSDAADAAVQSPETPAPLSVAPDPATQDRSTEAVGGSSTLLENRADTAAASPAADGPPAEQTSAPEHADEVDVDETVVAEASADETSSAEEPADAEK